MRPLDPADLPAGLDLAADRGWPREDVKGRFALAAGSVFGIDDPGGGLAATAGGPVRVDVPARHAGVSRWLAGRGVRPAAPGPLMSHEGRPRPGDRDQLYALFMRPVG